MSERSDHTRLCIERYHPNFDIDKKSQLQSKVQRAIYLLGTKWPQKATLKVYFIEPDPQTSPNWTPLDLLKSYNKPIDPLEYKIRNMNYFDAVKTVIMERIQPLINLTIQFTDDPTEAVIRIRFKTGGGSSCYVGTRCKSMPVTLNPVSFTTTYGWMDFGTIAHEFCHALGLVHEHQSPFGGIKWNDQAVYEWAKRTQGWPKETTYQNIIKKYNRSEVNGTSFDNKSIMLYFFSPDLTLDHSSSKPNMVLSDKDKWLLSSMYPRDGKVYTIPSNKSYPNPMVLILVLVVILVLVKLILAIKRRREVT